MSVTKCPCTTPCDECWTEEQWEAYYDSADYYDSAVMFDAGIVQILHLGMFCYRYWRLDHQATGKGRDYKCITKRVERIFSTPGDSFEAALQVIAWQKYREAHPKEETNDTDRSGAWSRPASGSEMAQGVSEGTDHNGDLDSDLFE